MGFDGLAKPTLGSSSTNVLWASVDDCRRSYGDCICDLLFRMEAFHFINLTVCHFRDQRHSCKNELTQETVQVLF